MRVLSLSLLLFSPSSAAFEGEARNRGAGKRKEKLLSLRRKLRCSKIQRLRHEACDLSAEQRGERGEREKLRPSRRAKCWGPAKTHLKYRNYPSDSHCKSSLIHLPSHVLTCKTKSRQQLLALSRHPCDLSHRRASIKHAQSRY